ncbi:MAG TPA: hypothetical protein EYP19_14060 [Desulfobacterales bacterium]|nr:hypothetical protein [Desulfobacterales bacterium]
MELETITYKNLNLKEIGQKGRERFRAISKDLEKEHFGKAVAIEVESGDYFIGETGVEATKKARKKYPDRIFYLAKIGYGTYVSFRGRK